MREQSQERIVPRKTNDAYGVGTVILSPHRPGMVLAIEEKVQKSATGRETGQLSIPLETEVEIDGKPEKTIDTIRASLAEVMDDRGIADVGKNFHLVSHGDLYVSSEVNLGVHVKPAVVLFDGDPDYEFFPTVTDEVGSSRWVHMEALTRPLAKEVVFLEYVRGELSAMPKKTEPLFPEDFSLEQLQKKRSQHPDRIYYTKETDD